MSHKIAVEVVYALPEKQYLQRVTLEEGATWSNRAANLPTTGALNVHTVAVPGVRSFLRLTVAQ